MNGWDNAYAWGYCPACSAVIRNAQAIGVWDGVNDGGLLLRATCEQCHAELSGQAGNKTVWHVVNKSS